MSCHPNLGESKKKWKQRPDMIIAVDLDVGPKASIQTNIFVDFDSTSHFFRERQYIDTRLCKHGYGNLHIFISVFAVPIYMI